MKQINFRNFIICVSLAITAPFFAPLKAQHPLGLVIGDVNTPYASFLNPSMTRSNLLNRAFINWWGTSFSLDNNFTNYNAPFRLSSWLNQSVNSTSKPESNFDQSWIPLNGVDKNWTLNYLNEVYGPSIYIPIDYIGGVGFGVKSTSGVSLNGIDKPFGSLLRFGFSPEGFKQITDLNGNAIQQGEFSINTEKYQEWYLSFAGYNDPNAVNAWKWGITTKFLLGMSMAHLGSDALNIQFPNTSTIQVNQANMRMYYSGGDALNTLNSPFGLKFDLVNGAGLGLDLGFTYEFRPGAASVSNWGAEDPCKREKLLKYVYKFGASITDLGFISYDGHGSEVVSATDQTIAVDANAYNSLTGTNQLSNITQNFLQPLGGEEVYQFVSYSPTALNVQFDHSLNNNWHLGAYWTQNLKPKNSVGLKRQSYFAVVPRWETERMELGMPITLANDYNNLNWGVYGRFGPLIVGSDNLVGLGQFVKNDHYTGASFYFGFRSKIGGCERQLYYQPITKQDSAPKNQPVVQNKPIKKDTVFVPKIVKDTVYVKNTNPKNNAEIGMEALKKKEADLKVQEEQLKLKEKKLSAEIEAYEKKKKDLESAGIDAKAAGTKLADLEQQLAKTKADLATEKQKNATISAEMEKLKAKVVTTASNVPCDEKLKRLDSLWGKEIAKNATITAQLGQKDQEIANKNAEILKKNSEITAKNADIIAKDGEINRLKSEYSLLKAKCDESDKKLAQLNAQLLELQKLNSTNASCCDKMAKLENDLAIEKGKNATITAELQKAKLEVDALKNTSGPNDPALLNAKIALLEAQVKKQQEQINILTADKKACEDKLKVANATITATAGKEDCTPYKTQLAQVQAQLSEAQKNLATALADKKACEDKLKAANATITATGVKEDCTPYKNQLALVQAQLADAQKNLATALADKKACEDKLKVANATITATAGKEDCTPYKTRVAELEKQNADLNAKITALNATVKSLEEKVAASSKITASEDCTPYKTKIVDLEKSLASSQTELTSTKAKLDAANSAKAELTAQLQKCADMESKLTACKADADKLKSDLDNANAKVADLEAKLSKISSMDCSALQELVNKLRGDLASKNAELTEAQGNLSKCNDDLDALKTKQSSITADLANSNATVENLRKQVIDQDAQMAALGDQIKSKDAEIARLKAQVKVLQDSLKKCEDSLPKTDSGTGN